jgi:PAS domain S-box-containing protein
MAPALIARTKAVAEIRTNPLEPPPWRGEDPDVDEKLARMRAQGAAESRKLTDAIAESKQLSLRLRNAKRAIRDEHQRSVLLRERMNLILGMARGGSFHWHRPSGEFECDEGVARLYGLAHAEEMKHTHLVTQLDTEDGAAMQFHWSRCVERNVPFEIDVRVPNPMGSRWVSLRARGMDCDASGRPCVIGACVDSTALHIAGEMEGLLEIADAIPQLVWIADAEGHLEYTNERWFEYTGHGVDHLDASSLLLDAVAEPDRLAVRERWLSTVRAGHDLEVEARLVSRTGHVRWFLLRAVPMIGPRGVIVRWAGTCTDIDAQKRAELELTAARDVRDKAMATLGHELRTPLSAISCSVDVARARTPMIARECSTIERQVGRMSRMVEDMFDITRVERGRITLRPRPTDVGVILFDAIEMCSKELAERSHNLETVIEPQLIADADADRLAQVFVNLLSNAAKYTPPGGHITVRAGRGESDIVVEVRDDGVGITSELQARLFEPFVQAENSSARRGGLGIGLSIAKSLVELHGGTIAVASDGHGHGSTFTIRLPQSTALPAVRKTMAKRRETMRRVLLVQDRPDIAGALASVLRDDGFEVAVANDARSAIELSLWSPMDVVLIDTGLQDTDAVTLAYGLRKRLGDRCPRLVAVSSVERPSIAREAKHVFEQWLLPPFDADRVRAVVAGPPPPRSRRRPLSRTKSGV